MGNRTVAPDDVKRVVEVLQFHANETLDIDTLAAETGLDWGTVYNSLLLTTHITRAAPEFDRDQSTLHVGESDLFDADFIDSEMDAVLAYLFVHTKSTTAITLDTHSFLTDRSDAIDTARDNEYVTCDGNTIALTPAGLNYIGPQYSRYINDAPDSA